MAQIGLQRPCVGSPIGQGIACCVPEHVWMALERQLGLDPRPLDQLGEARHGERSSTLGDEYERRFGVTL